MQFYSTNSKIADTSFKEAVIKGLPADNGLFMPESIPQLPEGFFKNIGSYTLQEIALEIACNFVGHTFSITELEELVNETLSFDIPLVEVERNIYSLELYHGPTLAFKDVGARFLARCLSKFSKEEDKKTVVLVATSGDTGSAVAHGFYNVPNVDVIVLYPSGKVSPLQESQFTTLGGNIKSLEINGTFDDCQKMVKQAFLDQDLNDKLKLTSANSINIARMIPQSFYYFWAYAQLDLKDRKKVVFSIPSGNYGNMMAGILAKRMGLPIHKMIAASNDNDIVPTYLDTGVFDPRPSVSTISNAMDVGNPSNFARMLDAFDNDWEKLTEEIEGASYTDEETRETMRKVKNETGYVLDPHGAIGYRALKDYQKENDECTGIFLETAHPAKFKEVVEETLEIEIEVPERLALHLKLEKKSTLMEASFESFKEYLMAQ